MIVCFAIILGSIFADQLTKWLAVVFLEGEADLLLWEGVLHFSFVRNEGAAFGMLQNQRWLFMVVSTIAIAALFVYLFRWKPKSLWVRVSIAMIIGGGIGNMIDRLLLGYVIDFIYVSLIDFPVFNVADSFVTVGSFMLIGYLLWDTVKEFKRERALQKAEAEADAALEEKQNDGREE